MWRGWDDDVAGGLVCSVAGWGGGWVGAAVRSAGGGRTEGGMEANGSLVAGSHNRNELVVIRQDGDGVNAHSLTFSHFHV